MIIEITEEEAMDLKRGFYIVWHSSEHKSMIPLFDRLEAIDDKIDAARGLYNPSKPRKEIIEKKALSVKILSMFVAGFLDPTLDAGNMIAVFDIVEHNPDGKTRLSRLIEEKCTRILNPQEMAEATELLEDYPTVLGARSEN